MYPTDLLPDIIYKTQAKRHGNNYLADCVFCGKEYKHGQTHFVFNHKGYKCFICSASGGLVALARHLGIIPEKGSNSNVGKLFNFPVVRSIAHKPVQQQAAPAWLLHPDRAQGALIAHPGRIALWQKYKPISGEAIAKYGLGCGVLPATACRHARLTYPVYQDKKIIALRGRAIDCDCPKWLSSAGSKAALFTTEQLYPGCDIIICENPIDAILAAQYTNWHIVGAASTSGAGTFRDEWVDRIANIEPASIIVWLDNDGAGCANKEAYVKYKQEFIETFRKKFPDRQIPQIPTPNGIKIASMLRAKGAPVKVYQWPVGTPYKYDIGQLIIDRMK